MNILSKETVEQLINECFERNVHLMEYKIVGESSLLKVDGDVHLDDLNRFAGAINDPYILLSGGLYDEYLELWISKYDTRS